MAAAREQARSETFLAALERFWVITFPAPWRDRLVTNDPVALEAAWQAALAEGPVSDNLGGWRMPCLIFRGAGDVDFLEQARRAADEIADAASLSLAGRDHYGAHTSGDALVFEFEAVLRTLRHAHLTTVSSVCRPARHPCCWRSARRAAIHPFRVEGSEPPTRQLNPKRHGLPCQPRAR